MDADGKVDWNEFALYLKWAGRQYPQTQTAEELLSIAFRKGLVPAMKDELVKDIKLPESETDEDMREESEEEEDFDYFSGRCSSDDDDDYDF